METHFFDKYMICSVEYPNHDGDVERDDQLVMTKPSELVLKTPTVCGSIFT